MRRHHLQGVTQRVPGAGSAPSWERFKGGQNIRSISSFRIVLRLLPSPPRPLFHFGRRVSRRRCGAAREARRTTTPYLFPLPASGEGVRGGGMRQLSAPKPKWERGQGGEGNMDTATALALPFNGIMHALLNKSPNKRKKTSAYAS